MNFILWGALLCLVVSAPAPNPEVNPLFERRDHGTYIEEITFLNKRREVAVVRTFTPSGVRIAEEHYVNYDQGIKHGITRSWYPNGQTYWSCDYKNGEMHGPLLVFYPDGSTKRRAYYKWGMPRESKCFDQNGQPLLCDDFIKPAGMAMTEADFLATLKAELRKGGFESTNLDRYVSVLGIIEADGLLTNLSISAPDDDLSEVLKTAVKQIPRWKPATVDGNPVPGHYYVSLLVRNREVYLSK